MPDQWAHPGHIDNHRLTLRGCLQHCGYPDAGLVTLGDREALPQGRKKTGDLFPFCSSHFIPLNNLTEPAGAVDSASGQSHPQAVAWGLWGALTPRFNKTSTAMNSLPQSLSSLHSSSSPLLTVLTRFLSATSGLMSTLAGIAPQHEETPCSSVSAFTLFSFRVALQDVSVR